MVECWEELPVLDFVMWCQDSFRGFAVSRCTRTVQNFLESNRNKIGLDFAAVATSLSGSSLGPAECENAIESHCEHVQVLVEDLCPLLVGFWCPLPDFLDLAFLLHLLKGFLGRHAFV